MDIIYQDKEATIGRFVCDCFDAGHSLTTSIERDDKTGEAIFCEFRLFIAGKPSLWWRLKSAYKCLEGRDGDLGEFLLRREDYPAIIKLLNGLVKTSWTAGN